MGKAHSHGTMPTHSHSFRTAFAIGIGLNAAFTAAEFALGIKAHSMALLADATHNLSDVASLLIAWLGYVLLRKKGPARFTYGYRKASILASLLNSVLLFGLVIQLFIESIQRLNTSEAVDGPLIAYTAGIGIGVNLLSAWFFRHGQQSDLNLKVLFAHLLVDALVSLGAVISGLLIATTSWTFIDPIMGMVIALVILFSTWRLFTESLRLSLDASPHNLLPSSIAASIAQTPGVKGVAHLHLWALSSRENALSVHLQLAEDLHLCEALKVKQAVRNQLQEMGIGHVTIELEVELPHEHCPEPQQSHGIHHHH